MQIIFAGTPNFAVETLHSLYNSKNEIVAVYCQPDKPRGRGKKISACPVKVYAKENNLNVFQPTDLSDKKVYEQLKEHNADIMVVVAYGKILPKNIIHQPKYGCLNIHASLLPRWRGASPIQSAILSGDKKTGISIIKISEELDAGDVLLQLECDINANDNYSILHDKLAKLGADNINNVINNIANIKPIKQQQSLVSYAKKISKNDAWINWNDSAINIQKMINAFNPKPIAKCKAKAKQFNNKNLGILKAKVSKKINKNKPGEVNYIDKNSCYVATGDGLLELEIIQLEGKKPSNIKDFNNAYNLQKLS